MPTSDTPDPATLARAQSIAKDAGTIEALRAENATLRAEIKSLRDGIPYLVQIVGRATENTAMALRLLDDLTMLTPKQRRKRRRAARAEARP